MGNVLSNASTSVHGTKHVTGESETMSTDSSDTKENESIEEEYLDATNDDEADDEARAQNREEDMMEFRKQLSVKREQRRQILDRHKSEKMELEKSLNDEKKARLELHESNKLLRELLTKNNVDIPENLLTSYENSDFTVTIAQMREEFDNLKANNKQLRRDIVESNNALQNAYSDIADLNSQNTESIKQISALKEVVAVSKTMISLREQQLDELKEKLSEIEKSLADREASMLSTDLRQEYERQLQNIRTLRGLYEERARLAEVTRQSLVRELEEQKALYQTELTKSKALTDKVKELEEKVDELIETIDNKNSQISVSKDESVGLKAEMTVVNKLFSEVLLGYKTKKDLDKLVHRLEENHGILTQMAERENDSEASTALPKLLLEIVNQVEQNNTESSKDENGISQQESLSVPNSENLNTASASTPEEIVQNLPKVWRVLMELLSHQNVADANPTEKVTTCYKSVETKSGPVLVPSVSQTYIRLKDLIIEKLALVKEVNRIKQLNCHLETRLEEQERRLCLVTTELGKTWHVVGRLRRHHHQLHTHEKILKYELQQKRKLLNELKEELEYCRDKWEQAREKNSQSERDWKTLKAEFTSRKTKTESPSFNNSAESGYSDERPSDESSGSNDESASVTQSHVRCKKKNKKPFEPILDSSADFNLAAEREDPVSDMLDVADLPLDTHDDSQSERILKNELLCEETEDEVGDINADSYTEDLTNKNIGDNTQTNYGLSDDNNCNTDSASSSKNTQILSVSLPNLIDCADVLNNPTLLRTSELQNESQSKKDEKQNELQSNSSVLVKQPNEMAKYNEEIHNTLDHIISNPTTSRELHETDNVANTVEKESLNATAIITECNKRTTSPPSTEALQETEHTIDFKAILENVKKQDERIAKKEKRLQDLESGCSEVVSNINNTLQTGEKIEHKLDILHTERVKTNDIEYKSDDEDSKGSLSTNEDEAEPSTSSEIDHEARFAARDIRLKRLEEQTKSLVNKVNKTTSKGVKINYKLEELHNIYGSGSENSRAGTPSENNEDKNDEEEPSND